MSTALEQAGPVRADGSARVLGRRLGAPGRRVSTRPVRTLSIVIGGGSGVLARAGIAQAFPHATGAWPWATFSVNLGGAFLLGWLLTRLTERIAVTQHWRTLLGTGLCGGLTTFSTFQVETIQLARGGHVPLAVMYAALSAVLGLACALGGTVAARWGRYR